MIVTSSLDELDSVVRCLEMGAEDYLYEAVNPCCSMRESNGSLEKKRLRDQQRELIGKFATKEVKNRRGFHSSKYPRASADGSKPLVHDDRGSPRPRAGEVLMKAAKTEVHGTPRSWTRSTPRARDAVSNRVLGKRIR